MEVGGGNGCCCRWYCRHRRGRKALLLVDDAAAATGGVGPSYCGRERKEWWLHKRTVVEGDVGAAVGRVPGAAPALPSHCFASTKKKGLGQENLISIERGAFQRERGEESMEEAKKGHVKQGYEKESQKVKIADVARPHPITPAVAPLRRLKEVVNDDRAPARSRSPDRATA
ncbi:hypothetical protein PIB30_104061 [Stylosanthes scabra]|uniref:Uncharacterized protein n=1 Tax=Stylosanthes scabra TaxID=79078 RepID=A0ABU6TZJ0_9FABA|nr:hypothetical protein [Stylosanthes scabra]